MAGPSLVLTYAMDPIIILVLLNASYSSVGIKFIAQRKKNIAFGEF